MKMNCQNLLAVLMTTTLLFGAMPFSFAAEAALGIWTDAKAEVTYEFLKDHKFRFSHTKLGEREEGAWDTGRDICWLGEEDKGQTGNLMIYLGTVQCCLDAQMLGQKLILGKIWQKPFPFMGGVCENRVLVNTKSGAGRKIIEEAEEAERQKVEAKRLQKARAKEAERLRRDRALTAAEKYKLLIHQKVNRNWARPPGAQTALQCTVRVKLVPTGDVLQVSVVKSSGDERFDRSVENAVYKASPLPLPEDGDLFEYFREIEFIFNPDDY